MASTLLRASMKALGKCATAAFTSSASARASAALPSLAAPAVATKLAGVSLPKVTFQPSRSFAHLAHSHYLPREEIEARVMELLSTYPRIPKDKLTNTAHLMQDLGLDSLDCVEVIIEMEEEFQVTINDDDAAHLVSVKDIIDYFAHLPFVE